MADAMTNSNMRVLLPPSASPVWSSRFARMRAAIDVVPRGAQLVLGQHVSPQQRQNARAR
jgi:hypothetical protein